MANLSRIELSNSVRSSWRLRSSERALLLAFCALLRLGASAAAAHASAGPSQGGVLGRSRRVGRRQCRGRASAAFHSQMTAAFTIGGCVDDSTVLIQDIDGQWYKASLMTPCIDLPFTHRIGIESNPDGSFDEFGAIKLRHQTCQLTSLVKTGAPSKRSKPHKMAPRRLGFAPTAPAQPLPPRRRRSAPHDAGVTRARRSVRKRRHRGARVPPFPWFRDGRRT